MNTTDFLAEFKHIAREFRWSLEGKRIIGKKQIPGCKKEVSYCPATAHYEKCHNLKILDVQRDIIVAADGIDGHDSKIRNLLLEICGLNHEK